MPMQALPRDEYQFLTSVVSSIPSDLTYPCAVLEQRQSGYVFADRSPHLSAALVVHKCGFAYLAGAPDEALLMDAYRLILDGYESVRSVRLHVFDESAVRFFGEQPGLKRWEQTTFAYREGGAPQTRAIPDGYTLKRATARDVDSFTGRIVPAWSWDSTEAFLAGGFGYCVRHGEAPASLAFSAAIGDGCVDIGVETGEAFRRLGLAAAAGSGMVGQCLSAGLHPVWRAATSNPGSIHIAREIGFVEAETHPVFMAAPVIAG